MSQIQSKLTTKYPAISSACRITSKDADVTWQNYVSGSQFSSEFVVFAGHGNEDGLVTNDKKELYPSDKAYGGWTRWFFSDAYKNLFKSDVNNYAPMFGGLHSFFGYQSLSKWFIIPQGCNFFGVNCSYYRSEDVWDYFSDKWINQGMYMYDAWVQAIQAAIYNHGGYGVAPGAVYPYGNVAGVWFIGGIEKVTNMYNGDVDWNSLSHVRRYEVYGTPEY